RARPVFDYHVSRSPHSRNWPLVWDLDDNRGSGPMMLHRIRLLCLLLIVVPGLVFGQYGRPRRGRSGPANGIPGATPAVTFRGSLRSIDKKEIVIDAGEDQILHFKRTKKTRFWKGDKAIKPDDFPENAAVVIEANRALNGDLDAINVFQGEPPAAPEKPVSPEHSP